jgi:hypothetical protein
VALQVPQVGSLVQRCEEGGVVPGEKSMSVNLQESCGVAAAPWGQELLAARRRPVCSTHARGEIGYRCTTHPRVGRTAL